MRAGCLQKLSVKPQQHCSLLYHPFKLTRGLQPAETALTTSSKHHHAPRGVVGRNKSRGQSALSLAAQTETLSETNKETSNGASCGKVVIVGAGPAGALSAIYLAKQNYTVEVYESRPLPDPINRNLDRSYHLAMSHRGMGAVEKVGIDMSKFREFPYRGSLLQSQNGSIQEMERIQLAGHLVDETQRIAAVFHEPMSAKVLIERMELVRHIVDEAQRLAPDRITFHWSQSCHAVDIHNRTVTFSHNGSSTKVNYDLLIGADGVNSKVRDEMGKQIAGFQQQWFGRMHRIDKFFHRVKPPPGAEMNTHKGDLDKTATVLRFYYISSPPPLTVGLFFIHNHPDGTYSGGISYTRADSTEEGSGGMFKTADDFSRAMSGLTMYPEEMRDEIAKQFTERPWYTSGSTLQVSRLTAPSVVLIGDAAHAVSAAFGQGVNAALEDCSVLGDIVARNPGSIDASLERYERQRKPDVHALGTMDHQAEAFAGFRGKLNLSFWIFQTHLVINGWLHRMFPQKFADPNLVPMMTIQRSPYSTIYSRIKRPFFVLVIAASLGVLAVVSRVARLLLIKT